MNPIIANFASPKDKDKPFIAGAINHSEAVYPKAITLADNIASAKPPTILEAVGNVSIIEPIPEVNFVNVFIIDLIAGIRKVPNAIAAPSATLDNCLRLPAVLSILIFAILDATPSLCCKFLSIFAKSPLVTAFSKFNAPAIPIFPNTASNAFILFTWDKFLASLPKFIIIFWRGNILPVASATLIPNSFSTFDPAATGLARFKNDLFNAVPAILPLIPTFPKSAVAVVIPSILWPAAIPIGAATFKVSNNVSISTLAEDVAADNTSANFPVWDAFIPKAPSKSEVISDALPKSVPLAAAKFNNGVIADNIWLVLNPAFAKNICADAASVALNTVLTPSALACFDNRAIFFTTGTVESAAPNATDSKSFIDCSNITAGCNACLNAKPNATTPIAWLPIPLVWFCIFLETLLSWFCAAPTPLIAFCVLDKLVLVFLDVTPKFLKAFAILLKGCVALSSIVTRPCAGLIAIVSLF